MYHDLQEVYWWNGLKKVIVEFVTKCLDCQQVKTELQRPEELTQVIYVPTWKWEDINMDFVVGFLHIRNENNLIWVIVNRLTKSSHILFVKTTSSAKDYAWLYLNEFVRFNGVPLSIISNRGL